MNTAPSSKIFCFPVKIFALLIFWTFSLFLNAQAQVNLIPDKSVEEKIGGGEVRDYPLNLNANQFLRVTVIQRGADIVLSLVAPDGKILSEIDSPTGTSGTEELLFITEAAGAYKVRVTQPDKAAKQGGYTLKLDELRDAGDTERERLRAAKIVEEAFKIEGQRTAAGFTQAIEKYKEALAVYQKTSDRYGEANARSHIGQLSNFVGQFKAGLDESSAALELVRASPDRALEAQILDNIGQSYANLGETAKALDSYNQAVNLRKANNQTAGQTNSLSGIARIYQSIGEYEKAIEINNQLIPLYRESGNQQGIAVATSNLGAAYGGLGEHQKAIDLYLKVLPFFRAAKIGFFEINILNNLGYSYGAIGEQQKAIDYYNQALPIARATGNRSVEAQILVNIGSFYVELGDNQTALEYQADALKIWRELKQPSLIAITSNNIGMIRLKIGETETALPFLNEALPLARESKDRLVESYILQNFGAAYFQNKKYEDALRYSNQSLEIRRALNIPALLAQSLNIIAGSQAGLGRFAEADENFAEALRLVRTVNQPRIESEILFNLANAQNSNRRFSEARESLNDALKIKESVRSKVANQNLRATALADVRDYYELRTDVLLSLSETAKPNENFTALALESAENARARGLLELLNESHADIRQGIKPELLELERTTRQTLSAKANHQAQLLADAKTTPAQKEKIETEISELTKSYEQIQAEIRQTSPRYATLTQPPPVSVAEIQKQILDRDTVLLEYSLGKTRSFLWLVGQNSLEVYTLPEREKIEAAARKVYELLNARNRSVSSDKDLTAASAELSRLILPAKAANAFGKKRLLIVADGTLQYIPFAALPNGSAKNALLISSNEIVNLPSAATLIALRREAKPARTVNSIAVVADPVFETTDARILTAKKTTTPGKKDDLTAGIVKRAADESGFSSFARLRFSRDEADGIAALAPKENIVEILDFDANKETVLSGKLGKSNIIHFATHGIINSRNPELSGIVLSLVNEKGELQDGFLRLYEIYNLPLDADLTVLSACQTALGKDIRGEGLIGLTRGFMYAGSSRVVASLWSVDDRATSDLMRRFYQKMLTAKMRPAAALRAAQIEMSRNPRFANPYFWAAFTIQGEWR